MEAKSRSMETKELREMEAKFLKRRGGFGDELRPVFLEPRN